MDLPILLERMRRQADAIRLLTENVSTTQTPYSVGYAGDW